MKPFLKHLFSFDLSWFVAACIIVGIIGGIAFSFANNAWGNYKNGSQLQDAWYDGRYTACYDISVNILKAPQDEADEYCMVAVINNVAQDIYEKRVENIIKFPSPEEAKRLVNSR